jgi:prepilin-type processing-associated H-X9-DG protein
MALLAGVLAPVLTSAKISAMRSSCQSNLRQIGQAFGSYLADNDACYPCAANDSEGQYLWMGRYWRWPMKRYVGYGGVYDGSNPMGKKQVTRVWSSILRCPGDPTPKDIYDATSYGYSAAFYHSPAQVNAMTLQRLCNDPNPSFAVVRSGDVKYPSRKALAAEWLSAHSDAKVSWWSWDGERNYLFADGHVVYLSAKRIHSAVDNYPDINLTVDGVAGRDVD